MNCGTVRRRIFDGTMLFVIGLLCVSHFERDRVRWVTSRCGATVLQSFPVTGQVQVVSYRMTNGPVFDVWAVELYPAVLVSNVSLAR